MLSMLESQTRPGVTREQMAHHLSQRLKPGAWDLIRDGVVSNVLYKTGADVGFFAVLNAPSLSEPRRSFAKWWSPTACSRSGS